MNVMCSKVNISVSMSECPPDLSCVKCQYDCTKAHLDLVGLHLYVCLLNLNQEIARMQSPRHHCPIDALAIMTSVSSHDGSPPGRGCHGLMARGCSIRLLACAVFPVLFSTYNFSPSTSSTLARMPSCCHQQATVHQLPVHFSLIPLQILDDLQSALHCVRNCLASSLVPLTGPYMFPFARASMLCRATGS